MHPLVFDISCHSVQDVCMLSSVIFVFADIINEGDLTLTRQKKQAAMCIAEERAKRSLKMRRFDGLISNLSESALREYEYTRLYVIVVRE